MYVSLGFYYSFFVFKRSSLETLSSILGMNFPLQFLLVIRLADDSCKSDPVKSTPAACFIAAAPLKLQPRTHSILVLFRALIYWRFLKPILITRESVNTREYRYSGGRVYLLAINNRCAILV